VTARKRSNERTLTTETQRASLEVLLDYEFQTVAVITFDDTKLEDRDKPPGCA